jgi:lipid II:glycine glycyltransferase (peptidoglycan interpeptide bridge formation enzyme)
MRHLLQSAEWADFHESLGTKVIRHQSKNGNFIAFFERSHGKVGKLLSRLYLPYGPYAEDVKQLKVLLKDAERLARDHKADYIRVEPVGLSVEAKTMNALGYEKRQKSSQPEHTNIVDLRNKSIDEIIASMNATNRNLWRANAGRQDGLTFTVSYEATATKPLIDMMQTTAERLGVVFHDAAYTVKMVESLGPKKACGIVYASHGGKELAGAQFVVDEEAKTLYYLHAGSYFEARTYNAGNLLLTYLILLAHERGLDFVDLFGVAPKDAPKDHPYAGFSSFKRSFGGVDVEYSGTWEKGLNKLKYKLMTTVRNQKA